MNMATDLFLMAVLAFKQGNYQQAGLLFASAINSEDCDDLVRSLLEKSKIAKSFLTNQSSINNEEDMSTAVNKLIASMESTADDFIEDKGIEIDREAEDDTVFIDEDEEEGLIEDFYPGSKITGPSLSGRRLEIESEGNFDIKIK